MGASSSRFDTVRPEPVEEHTGGEGLNTPLPVSTQPLSIQDRRRQAARRAAETRRINRLLSKTPYGRLLAALRDAVTANQQAKERAANGLHIDDYFEHDSSDYARANYRRSRAARERDYRMKDVAVAHACELATACGINFGWRVDGDGPVSWVVYFDLPVGQVSFHQSFRGSGPDYGGAWDGQVGASPARVAAEIARITQRSEDAKVNT